MTHGPANLDLPRRLAAFRHELHTAGSQPSRSTLEQLATVVRDLNLQDQDIEEELEEIRACAEGLDLADEIARGSLPVVATTDSLAAGDICHFAIPVRFGRRHTDQLGDLQLTNGWFRFRAVLDVSVAWSEVAKVSRAGREVEITLADSTRLMRFWCPCLADAARAAVLAAHFARAARGRAADADAASHAWL